MEETEVKRALDNFLKRRYTVVLKEYDLPMGGRIDYLSFNWEDDYEIGIRGFECKGSPYSFSVLKILREQVSGYQNVVPTVYLVLSSNKLQELKNLCNLNRVGLINVDKKGKVDVVQEAPKPPQPLLESAHFRQLRAKAAMFLSFTELFGERLRQGNNWFSTPEKNTEVQFNTWYSRSGHVNFSVNLENSRIVMKRINLQQLRKELSCLPAGYWVGVWLKNFYAPRTSVDLPLFEREASQVELEDLKYLGNRSKREVVHFQVGTHLWYHDELLPKRVHMDRLRHAKEQLSSIHRIMSK